MSNDIVLLVSVKMHVIFWNYWKIPEAPRLVSLVVHVGLVFSVQWSRSVSPGSCCLINDYIKMFSTRAVWAKFKQTNKQTSTSTPLQKHKHNYSMEKFLIWLT